MDNLLSLQTKITSYFKENQWDLVEDDGANYITSASSDYGPIDILIIFDMVYKNVFKCCSFPPIEIKNKDVSRLINLCNIINGHLVCGSFAIDTKEPDLKFQYGIYFKGLELNEAMALDTLMICASQMKRYLPLIELVVNNENESVNELTDSFMQKYV